jgi:hypothetical protein
MMMTSTGLKEEIPRWSTGGRGCVDRKVPRRRIGKQGFGVLDNGMQVVGPFFFFLGNMTLERVKLVPTRSLLEGYNLCTFGITFDPSASVSPPARDWYLAVCGRIKRTGEFDVVFEIIVSQGIFSNINVQ